MTGSTVARVAVVVLFTTTALGLSWWLMPKREYLPLGNQNFVFGQLLPPPGYSLEEVVGLQKKITTELEPLWEHPAGSPEARAAAGGGIQNYFFVALSNFAFMGARSNDPLRAAELIPEFQAAASDIPGSIFVMSQRSLFQRGISAGRTIDVEITGPELPRLIGLGAQIFGQVMQDLPGAQAQPIPSLDLGNPEVRVAIDRRRAAELGLSNQELGYTVSALVDGAKASDYQHEGREIDLRLRADEEIVHRTHLLEQLPIATPDGSLVTLGSVADITVVNGPVQVNHMERERSITIRVTPVQEMPLEQAMDVIDAQILEPMRRSGQLGGLYQALLSGSADKLRQTARTIRWDLLLALVITYLLLSALFESFLYPFVIMFSVPLAALGGFLGLAVVNLFTLQLLDVLTMLGFIILIGTVVNNAILIVHQSLNHMREDAMEPRDAIRESVRNRMRPIFMSVTTSVFGMLPLIVFPGAGSELYRGLGSVVVGGLVVSTLFTLFLVPALFSLMLDLRRALATRLAATVGSGRRGARPA
jgi:HAE1 family hydrophobic/amphiphilic exporter-1